MTTRDDIAAAASTVTGVNVSAYYRQSTKPGDGWVSLTALERDASGLGYMERWSVSVCLSQDIAAAEKWIEDNTDDLIAALSDQLVITAALPSTLVLDTASVPGLVIEGSRGH